MNRLVLLALCACPAPRPTPPGGGTTASCDQLRDKLEILYRADAQQREPRRVDEAVADNTQMVMSDCKKAPAKVAPCVVKAQTVAEIETTCLIPLDEEGTEGGQ